MMKAIIVATAALVIAFASVILAADTPNFGSYIGFCIGQSEYLRYHNFVTPNCTGPFTVKQDQINKCQRELGIASWKGACNTSHGSFFNYLGWGCHGKSVLTRNYVLGRCFACPNKECKNP